VADRVVRRARGGLIRSAGPKRVTQWIGSAEQGIFAVGSNTSVLVQSNATLQNTTVIRVRGLLSVQPGSFAADLDIKGALGFALVSDQAAAAGAVSIPGPWTDLDWGGWFLWVPWAGRVEFRSDTGIRFFDSQINIPLDSKAMRKVAPNETLVVMAESQVGAANVNLAFRMLVKLA